VRLSVDRTAVSFVGDVSDILKLAKGEATERNCALSTGAQDQEQCRWNFQGRKQGNRDTQDSASSSLNCPRFELLIDNRLRPLKRRSSAHDKREDLSALGRGSK
jgi:hypothetical protein